MSLSTNGAVEQEIFTKKVSSIRSAYITDDQKIIVSHIGQLDQRKINTLSSLVEAQLEYLKASKAITKRVFNIVIEALQNIALHGDIAAIDPPLTYLLIGKNSAEYTIYAGNMIANSKVKALDTRLKRVQSFSAFELKKEYMEVLANGELSEKGGAGLGFLTMALKSKEIGFDFTSLNEGYSLFSIQLKVLK